MEVELASVDGERRRAVGIWMEQRPIDALDELGELLMIGRVNHEHSARLARRKPAIVQIVAVHRDERPAKVVGEPVVAQVRRPAQLVLFENEEHIPVEVLTHVGDEPGGHVRVGVDARPRRETFRMRREL